jgi:hypothetical protein
MLHTEHLEIEKFKKSENQPEKSPHEKAMGPVCHGERYQ